MPKQGYDVSNTQHNAPSTKAGVGVKSLNSGGAGQPNGKSMGETAMRVPATKNIKARP